MSENIKCLVWDLDNTLWAGTLLESGSCKLRPQVETILKELDNRGILLSIASANDKDMAEAALKKEGVLHYFLCPQIGWGNKVSSLQMIARQLNIGIDALGFIDDEPYEREQVRHLLPAVRVYDAEDYKDLPDKPELNPRFRTDESRRRRVMYLQELEREQTKKQFQKSRTEFLNYCETKMTIRPANNDDFARILELMHRTHQLNATGTIYTPDQIASFFADPNFKIYVAELSDRFVDYGKIGVAICRCKPGKWELISFFLSCRVLTRGIGNFFISWLQCKAYKEGASHMEGHFIKRERNQRMSLLYTMAGFKPLETQTNGLVVFSKECIKSLKKPGWLRANGVED